MIVQEKLTKNYCNETSFLRLYGTKKLVSLEGRTAICWGESGNQKERDDNDENNSIDYI